MRQLSMIALLLPLAAGAAAQSYGESKCEHVMAQVEHRFELREQERQAAEAFAQQRFARRANEFVERWNAFVDQYNQGKLDLRAARELSKSFRKLERSGLWPAADKEKQPNPR